MWNEICRLVGQAAIDVVILGGLVVLAGFVFLFWKACQISRFSRQWQEQEKKDAELQTSSSSKPGRTG